MYLAWKHGGEDPYCLFNMLDRDFVPVVGGARRPPPYPSRRRHFIYACARKAEEESVEQATAQMQRRGMV